MVLLILWSLVCEQRQPAEEKIDGFYKSVHEALERIFQETALQVSSRPRPALPAT